MRLYDYLLRAAEECPHKAALEFQGFKISYGELATEARQVAAGLLAEGIKPGDSVGLVLPNIPQFASVHYGALMVGAIVVPMNVLLKGPEIEYVVTDSDIKAIVTYEMFVASVAEGVKNLPHPPKVFVVGANVAPFRPYRDLLRDDSFQPIEVDTKLPVMTIYTSGTTGKPKGALLTNSNVIANLDMIESVAPTQSDDKMLCVLPLFHVFALIGILNSCMRYRTTIVLHPKFDVDACVKSLAEDGVTSFCGVPTMYFYILKHPKIKELKFPQLRVCFTGGAAMPVEVLQQFEKITGATVYEGFGMTETTVSVTLNRKDRRKIGSIGLPFHGVSMKIVDDDGREVRHGEVGEIIVKAANVMLGYLNKPEATAETLKNGWLYTGDLGYRDDDGFFYIVDRKKDMIIKGGYNIYPREIEEVLYQLPAVAEAAVLGVFDQAKGEHVRACVALKPNQQLTEDQVREHLEANLAKYKLPQEYVFLPELPKGPTGKILKRELAQKGERWNKDRVAAATGS